MLSRREAIIPSKTLCRDPVLLFHPTRYDRACVTERIQELVKATYALQCQHKRDELRHAAECHETAACVLGRNHPLARLMEDDIDPDVRKETINLLTQKNGYLSAWNATTPSPWMDALALLSCEAGKPREVEMLVEALWHSPAMETERGTIWILWLCALSCLIFPLDESHPLTKPLMDSLICTLAHKTQPTSSFSLIEECVLTICFLASSEGDCGPLRTWEAVNPLNDQNLRLRALVDNLSGRMAIGRSECLEQNDVTMHYSRKNDVESSSIGCTSQCHWSCSPPERDR